MLAEKCVNNAIFVTRYDHRCFQLCFLIGAIIVNATSCYAPQSSLSAKKEDAFYDEIISLAAAVPDEEMLLIGENFIGHVSQHFASFEGVYGGNDCGVMGLWCEKQR